MHTYQYITDHKSPTDHYRHISQPLTSMLVYATSCPRKGVTCRRVCDSHRYRWRQPLLSDYAWPSALRHRRPPSRAQARPRRPNPMLPPTQPLPAAGGLPTGHRPPNANVRAPLPRLGQIPSAILKALTPHICPGTAASGRRARRPLLPPRPTSSPRPRRSQFRKRPRRRRRPTRLEHRSSVG